MQLKFGLLNQKILSFIKDHYIFAFSPSEKCVSINQSRLICVWVKMSTGSHGCYHHENKECMRNSLENVFSGPSLSKATLFPWWRASLWDAKRENYLFLFGWVFFFWGFSLRNSPATKYHVSGYCNSVLFFWEQMSLLWQAETWLSLEERIQQDILLSWLVPLLEEGLGGGTGGWWG